MKRILALALFVFLLCSGSIPASAEETGIYETAGDLYAAWSEQNCVPEYITGVWSTDGSKENLTFGVLATKEGEMAQQEILALVQDDTTVTIVFQAYSRISLNQIMEEIVDAYFEEELGLVTVGVMEMENKLRIEVHTDYAANPDTLAMMQQVSEQYGNTVYFCYVDTWPEFVAGPNSTITIGASLPTNPQDPAFPFGIVLPLCGIVLCVFFLIVQHRHRLTAVTDGTAMVTGNTSIGVKEVEDAIRNADVRPSDALDDRIMASIQSKEP